MFSSAVTFALSLATTVSAHGYLRYIDHKGVTYGAWQVFSDPYLTPLPLRYDRSYRDNGPIVDFTGTNITCNNGPNDGANVGFINVNAGDKVKLIWDQWNSAHSGPVMTYMAKCTGGCATFKGNTGSPWFKIDQFGYDATKTPPWGSDYLHSQGDWWEVTIPPTLSSGEYLLRHEILGLHVAGTLNGAQFYPSCVHLRVTGSGSANPGNVALPGAYDPRDPGILAELWRFNQGQQIYTAPGGPVWSGAVQVDQTAAKPTSSMYRASVFAPSVRGGAEVPVTTTRVQTTSAVQTTAPGTTRIVTTTRAVITTTPAVTTTSRAATTSAIGGPAANLYGQCGGKGWTGATTCAQGTCKVSNEFYSQCLP